MLPHPRLEVRDLRLVRAIHLENTTARAARVLGLTQSAVSHQLRHLEERLGVEVFERMGRRLVITNAGQRLFDQSLQILEELVDLENAAKSMNQERTMDLRFATQCFTAYHWLPQAMTALQEHHSNVKLRLLPQMGENLVEALLQGELDLALSIEQIKDRRLIQKPLFRDELALIVAPSHPLAERSWVNGKDLTDQHLYLQTAVDSAARLVRQTLFADGHAPGRVTRLPLTEAIAELVRAGHGCSILATWAVAPYLERGELSTVALTRGRLKRRWVACYPRDSKLIDPIRTLIHTLKCHGPRL